MSSSIMPVPEHEEVHQHSNHNSPDSATGPSLHHPHPEAKPQTIISRHGTPLHTIEDSPPQQPAMLPQDELNNLVNGDMFDSPLQHSAVARAQGAPNVFRRARSATMMEIGPYPQTSHSCPIPTCGRLFKRLEHLKR